MISIKEAGVIESPFVTVFDRVGVPYAADLMNFVILTALLSAANSGLYASSRMLWSLSKEGELHPAFARLTSKGIPFNALIFSMIGGILSLLSSVFAADTVYLVLVSVSGFAVVAVWMSIAASQFCSEDGFLQKGTSFQT